MLNKSDVLGDGTVSFNSTTNTLTLSGEEIDTEEQYFIDNKFNGLTVNAAEDVSVFNYWNDNTLPSAAIRSEGDLTVTGGKLIPEGSFTENSVGIQMIGDRALNVQDADLTVRYFNFGMQGESASSAVLNVDSSYINLETDSPAVSVAVQNFKGGINFADGMGVIYPAMVTLDNGTIKNLDGSAAAYVDIGSTSSFYGISVAGVRVTESNKDDILGNGVFSFDPKTDTLTINKSYKTNLGQLIKNEIFGLTISVPNDVTITNGYGGEDGFELIYSTQSMTLTGGGRLFLFTQAVNGSTAFYMHSGRLTVLDATLAVSGYDYGILGNAAGANSLAVNNSEVRINSEEAAISDFRGGITLTDASVLYPSSGEISGGAVSWDSGVPAADVILGTKGSGLYSISVFGGSSANSTDAGRRISVYPYPVEGKYIDTFDCTGISGISNYYNSQGRDIYFNMPDNDVKLRPVYADQEPLTINLTNGRADLTSEQMAAFTESVGDTTFVALDSYRSYDLNGDGIKDVEVDNGYTGYRISMLNTYSVPAANYTLSGANTTQYWPVSFKANDPHFTKLPAGGEAAEEGGKIKVDWKISCIAHAFTIMYEKGGSWVAIDSGSPMLAGDLADLSGGKTTGFAYLSGTWAAQEQTTFKIRAHYYDINGGILNMDSEPFTIYNPVKYGVGFYLNYGNLPVSYQVQEVVRRHMATKPQDPNPQDDAVTVPHYYTFGGWYTEEECTTLYDFSTPVMGPVKLYAKWIEGAHVTVSFDANGASGVTVPDAQTFAQGEKAINPWPDGYVSSDEKWSLKYWSTDEDGENSFDFSENVNEDKTLYAQWEYVGTYNVSINRNGYGFDKLIKVKAGQPLERPVDPSTNECTHLGYYTEQECIHEYDFSQPVTGDLTLWNRWVKNPKLTFDPGEGSVLGDWYYIRYNTAPIDSIELSVPTLEGCVFEGWYENEGFTVPYTGEAPLTADKTVYAKWLKIGDVNLDGEIDINDVTAIQRYIAKLDTLSAKQLIAADADGDGGIDIIDATHLQKYITGLYGVVLG